MARRGTGIVTIATTNHAERLDAAILDRPSRFDRKYHFGLPAESERLAYVRLRNAATREEARLDGAGEEALARATEGFSYAYLKELMVSALVRWMSSGRGEPLAALAEDQVRALREQMTSVSADPSVRHTFVEDASMVSAGPIVRRR